MNISDFLPSLSNSPSKGPSSPPYLYLLNPLPPPPKHELLLLGGSLFD